jgi:hypothetical protein
MHKLQLRLNEQFNIERNGTPDKNTYMFTSTGLMVQHRRNGMWWEAFSTIIRELNEGSAWLIKH